MSERIRIEGPMDVGMLALRADLSSPPVKRALKAAFGAPVPGVRRIAPGAKGHGAQIAWMAPDELLILLESAADAAEALPALEAALGGAALALDVSAARVLFRLHGPGAREVLAKGAPADLRPAAFGPGDFRRTRLGQIAAAFWAEEGGEAMGLVCHRSVADHAALWLTRAARPEARVGVM